MPKRVFTLTCVIGVLAAACGTIPKGQVEPGSGPRFVIQAADSVDDVGLGNAIALDKDGVPFISYWGFHEDVKGIPVTRPIGAPYIPAVQVSSQASNGIWTRGAAAQVQDTPSTQIYVPYGPATVKSLKDATADNTNGTDVAIAADGTKNVVWAAPDGVYFAGGTTSFTQTQIFKYGSSLSKAGPIGRPSVAVDSSGTPWVAYTVNAAEQEVRVATVDADGKWQTSVVARLPQCGGCPQPGPARIVSTPTGPVVAFADGSGKAVMVATSHLASTGSVVPGSMPAWTTQKVASGVTGSGLSATVASDGSIYLAYYTGDGAVQLATFKSANWSTSQVAEAAPGADEGDGNFAETTGVAADDKGKIYVAFYDGKKDAAELVSGDGTTFTPISTIGAQGGRYPSIAVTGDGSKVFMAWYVNQPKDLRLGTWGSLGGQAIAYPSPTASLAATASTCKPSGTKLSITASGTAFQPTCLAAPLGSNVAMSFINKDALTHDFSIYPSQTQIDPAKAIFNGTSDSNAGSSTNTFSIDLSKAKAGTYYFQCDYHPATMFGSFIIAK